MTEDNKPSTISEESFTEQQTATQSESDSSAHDKHESETDEATLRKMTGAPDINQPLISKDAFADVDVRSSRPIWKLPVPKLAIIAVVLVPIFGLAGYFLAGGRSAQQQATVPTEPEKSTEPDDTEENSNLQEAEQEIASLKSQMALDDQAYVRETQKPKAPTAATRDSPSEPVTSSTVEPQAVSVSTRSVPPSVNYNPPPPNIRTSSDNFRSSPSSAAVPNRFIEVDPFAQWQQLARLGSYGNVGSNQSNNQSESELATNSNLDGSLPGSERIANTLPAAYFAPTSAAVPSFSTINFREKAAIESLLEDSEKEDSDKPEILTEAESQILDEQIIDTSSRTQSLIAGGHAAGELVTPVVIDNEGVGDRFMVVLSEPLTDNASRIAIPAGALLTVQVDRVAENGLVQLSATEAIWEEQGFQRELVLPSQTLLIRGDEGNPLTAESYGDIGGDIAAMDMGQFALGAIRRVGELYTRSDSRVQTGEGTTVITESNPEPNILAGALEGGSDAILDAISDRNQRAIEKLQAQPRIPHIPAGSSVQVFVNQSMQMPSGL